MKQVIGILLAMALVVLGAAGCGKQKHRTKIAILKIENNPALVPIENAIVEYLAALGYRDGQTAEILHRSVTETPAATAALMENLLNDDVDLVVAVSTPVALATMPYAEEIPVVFAAVSNPLAAGLCTNMRAPDRYMTGASDIVPVERILDAMREALPDSRTVGFIYYGYPLD